MTYSVPLKDILFTLEHVAGIGAVSQLPGLEDAGLDTAAAVLEECAKFNEGVVAPLNWPSDLQPSSLHNGVVTTSPGFVDAFRAYAQAGWQGLLSISELKPAYAARHGEEISPRAVLDFMVKDAQNPSSIDSNRAR